MAIPKLTEAQRKEALKKSLIARKKRAELKQDIKDGKKTLDAVLSKAKSDAIIGRTKVKALLQAIPGVGKAKAEAAMKEIGIHDTRRVAGLGTNQIEKLIEYFKK